MILDTLQSLWTKQWFKLVTVFVAGCLVTTLLYPSVSKESDTEEKIRSEVTTEYQQKLTDSEKEKDDLKQHYETQISSMSSESSQKEEELTQKITSLTTENSSLSKQTYTETVEIRKPDGTVELHKVSTTQLETLNQKVAEVQQQSDQKSKEQTDKLTAQYESQIADLKTSHQQELDKTSSELNTTKNTLTSERDEHTIELTNNRKLGLGLGYNTDKTYKAHVHYYFWNSIFGGAEVDTNIKDIYRGGLLLGFSF